MERDLHNGCVACLGRVGKNGKGRNGFYLDDVLAKERREGSSKFKKKADLGLLFSWIHSFQKNVLTRQKT